MNEFRAPGQPECEGDRGDKAPSSSTHDRGVRGRAGYGWRDRGATATEYAIMVSLIAVVIIGAVSLFGQNLIQLFQVPASAL
jgi:Flp pilus assembly pilin Flp